MTSNVPETVNRDDQPPVVDPTTLTIGAHENHTLVDRLAPVLDWVETTFNWDPTNRVDFLVKWTTAETQLLFNHNTDRTYSELGHGLLWCVGGLVVLRVATWASGALAGALWLAIWGIVAIALYKLGCLVIDHGKALIYPAPAPVEQTEPVILDLDQPEPGAQN